MSYKIVIPENVRGACPTGTFHPMKAGFACGSMVHFDLFSQNSCTVCNCFVKKDGIFRPAGGESGRLSRQIPARSMTA